MDKTTLKQHIDFLNIALESMDAESYEVAADFVEDVADTMDMESGYSARLHESVRYLRTGTNLDEARDLVEDVCSELVDLDAPT